MFDDDRYVDVVVEYAKAGVDDILIRITATNRGPEPAELHLLPTLWFRNTWSWNGGVRPSLRALSSRAPRPPGRVRASGGLGGPFEAPHDIGPDHVVVQAEHPTLGRRWLFSEGHPELLFTENDTNVERLWGGTNPGPYVKDGIEARVVNGRTDAVNPEGNGTKVAAHYRASIAPGASVTVQLRLTDEPVSRPFGRPFDAAFAARQREADEFYATVIPDKLSEDGKRVMRQAFAGLLWSKQFYHYDVRRWLEGDPNIVPPPAERRGGRNRDWQHLYNEDVVSMPDKWEYPWYAAWDLAFHVIPLALADPDFAKSQLVLFLREWYVHPNGQIPAYEWAFGDVNPPVHAWAALRVYGIEKKRAAWKSA